MPTPRYAVAVVARTRGGWVDALASWATSGAAPVELVQCVSVAQLRGVLDGGRTVSAAVLDGASPAVDRDLMAALADHGAAAFVVDGPVGGRDWPALGAAALLPPAPALDALVEALGSHAEPLAAGDLPGRDVGAPADDAPTSVAPLVAVTGPGGTGASTVAIALAEGLQASRPDDRVLLADLCRRADQAVLHDARDRSPALPELVELHRAHRPSTEQIVASTFHVVERGYHLLLGLRSPSAWSALRPVAVTAALDGLRAVFDVVVADVEDALEGERETGSVDVEDRHLLSRTAIASASVVVAVGRPGLAGAHGLVRTVQSLLDHGVAPEAVLPVWVAAPRSPWQRAQLHAALVESLDGGVSGRSPAVAGSVHLPARSVDAALRDGSPMPRPLPALLAGAASAVLARRPVARPAPQSPTPVAPGSLGV